MSMNTIKKAKCKLGPPNYIDAKIIIALQAKYIKQCI